MSVESSLLNVKVYCRGLGGIVGKLIERDQRLPVVMQVLDRFGSQLQYRRLNWSHNCSYRLRVGIRHRFQ